MLDGAEVRAYLAVLAVADPGRPSPAALAALHAAHVERVPYEALDIQRGVATSIDPIDSVRRILAGRGGYCYHLNGAFAVLLEALGYRVTRHRAAVQSRGAPPPGIGWANHMALTVDLDGERWFVDVGLADGLHRPLPLRPGVHRQPPFTCRLDHSTTEPGAWRFEHDPRGSFAGMDFELAPARPDAFAERHRYLSTSPESAFVRTCAVMRRDATGIDTLLGCVLTRRVDGGLTTSEIDTAGDWYAVLAGTFRLSLADLDAADRAELWTRVRAAHDAWRARRSTVG